PASARAGRCARATWRGRPGRGRESRSVSGLPGPRRAGSRVRADRAGHARRRGRPRLAFAYRTIHSETRGWVHLSARPGPHRRPDLARHHAENDQGPAGKLKRGEPFSDEEGGPERREDRLQRRDEREPYRGQLALRPGLHAKGEQGREDGEIADRGQGPRVGLEPMGLDERPTDRGDGAGPAQLDGEERQDVMARCDAAQDDDVDGEDDRAAEGEQVADELGISRRAASGQDGHAEHRDDDARDLRRGRPLLEEDELDERHEDDEQAGEEAAARGGGSMLALDLEEEASPEKHGADEAVAQEVAAEPDTAAQ